jgi:hypothetical protein
MEESQAENVKLKLERELKETQKKMGVEEARAGRAC